MIKKIIELLKKNQQFIKFVIVGLMNTTITLVIIFILFNIFKVDYKISNAIGYVAGLINSFFFNKLWTFKSNKNIFLEMLLFFFIFSICYFANLGLVVLLVECFGIGKNVAQFPGMILYTLLNYFGNKLLTFRKN